MANGTLICESHVKNYILRRSPEIRPGWPLTRVSQTALDDIDAYMRNYIDGLIKSHPSVGKTFATRTQSRKKKD